MLDEKDQIIEQNIEMIEQKEQALEDSQAETELLRNNQKLTVEASTAEIL